MRASQAFSVHSASLREKTENLCVRVCFVVNIYLTQRTRRTQRRTCSAVLPIRQVNASIASGLCALCDSARERNPRVRATFVMSIDSRKEHEERRDAHAPPCFPSGRLTRASQAFSVSSATLREKTENLCVRVCFVVNIYLTQRSQRTQSIHRYRLYVTSGRPTRA